jgi:hypothetical protein
MNSKKSNDDQSFLNRHSGLLRWAAILCLFLIVHLTHNRISEGFAAASHRFPNVFGGGLGDSLIAAAPTVKAILFVVSLIALTRGTVGEVYRLLRSTPVRGLVSTVLLSVMVTAILGALVIPSGPVSMGEGYADRSMHAFEQKSDWYHKRLLMPALAFLLFLRGEGPYLVFGFFITMVFIALLQSWLRLEARVSFLGLLSICTSSFVIYQFQAPGYPDILVFCFLLGVMFAKLSDKSKLVLLVLALLTPEASLFIGLPLAWRFLDRRRGIEYASVVGLYGFLWLAASRFRLGALMGSHNVEGKSGFEWMMQDPWLEAVGIFFAFKALWLLPIVAVFLGLKQRWSKDIVFIFFCLAAVFVLTTVGVDCTRMAGYGFPAILMALRLILCVPGTQWTNRALSGLFLVNLLIPSFSVGLNVGKTSRPGLYRGVWRFLT